MKYCYHCGQFGHIFVDCKQKEVSVRGVVPGLPNQWWGPKNVSYLRLELQNLILRGHINGYESFTVIYDMDTNTASEIEEGVNNEVLHEEGGNTLEQPIQEISIFGVE